jgi:hypothetical protein
MTKSELKKLIREILSETIKKDLLTEKPKVTVGNVECDCGASVQASCLGNTVNYGCHWHEGECTELIGHDCSCCDGLMPVYDPFLQNDPTLDPNLPPPPKFTRKNPLKEMDPSTGRKRRPNARPMTGRGRRLSRNRNRWGGPSYVKK